MLKGKKNIFCRDATDYDMDKRKKVIALILQLVAKKSCVIIFSALFAVSLPPAISRADDDVLRITIQELKAKMDRGEKIIILDVRSGDDYEHSKSKIAGSIRIALDQLPARYQELPAESEIVAYCA
jgi:hypothetical protein